MDGNNGSKSCKFIEAVSWTALYLTYILRLSFKDPEPLNMNGSEKRKQNYENTRAESSAWENNFILLKSNGTRGSV